MSEPDMDLLRRAFTVLEPEPESMLPAPLVVTPTPPLTLFQHIMRAMGRGHVGQ